MPPGRKTERGSVVVVGTGWSRAMLSPKLPTHPEKNLSCTCIQEIHRRVENTGIPPCQVTCNNSDNSLGSGEATQIGGTPFIRSRAKHEYVMLGIDTRSPRRILKKKQVKSVEDISQERAINCKMGVMGTPPRR
jgi:hypothetical protein